MMPPHVKALLSAGSSDLHSAVLDYVRRRIEAADRRWSQRYPRWRESERLYRAFRPSDLLSGGKRHDHDGDGLEKIIVPYGYAVIQSILAFFMNVLTQRKPLIPVEGSGPMDVRAALLMEVLLDRQMDQMRPMGTLVIYQWLLDALRYGVGIIKNHWTVREWPAVTRQTSPIIDPFTGQPMGMHDRLEQRDVTVYEGNEAQNVSPFDFLPDPNQPLNLFQDGEFCAQRMRRSWTQFRQRAAQGLYVGLDFVPRQPNQGSTLSTTFGTGRGISDAARIVDMDEIDFEYIDAQGTPYVELVEMYGYIDPEDFGLDEASGGSAPNIPTYPTRHTEGVPELWVFTMANGSRIVRAEPAMLPAMRFPYEIIEPNYDVQSPANFGMIETFRGLQFHLSWLYNSRMMNVEKTLNNEFVYDPSMIEEIDILDPSPARLLRLKEQHYQSGRLRDAIMQLPINDVTVTHLTDSKNVMDLIQNVTSANNLIMGLPNTGRRAATETQAQMQMSSGRMKMMIELVTSQGLRPWATQMAKNTQTFVSDGQVRLKPPYDRLLGAPMLPVNALMLTGEFSFPFTEAGMPTDRLFEANTWKELLMPFLQGPAGAMMMQQPWFPQMFMAMWGRFLHALNVKDLQTFGVSLPATVVAPDEMVMAQQQQGNLQPMGNPLAALLQQAGPPANGMAPTDGFALPSMTETPNVGNGTH